MQQVPANAFAELFNLAAVDLSNNELQHLPASVFTTCHQLQHVNLSSNKLDRIVATLFSALPALTALDLSQNQLSNDDFLDNLGTEVQSLELHLNLSGNHFRAVNISSLLSFKEVDLAGNWWSCKWLIKEMLRIPKSINFGRSYGVSTDWSLSMLEAKGISCYDEDARRNLIILDTSKIWEQKFEDVICGVS